MRPRHRKRRKGSGAATPEEVAAARRRAEQAWLAGPVKDPRPIRPALPAATPRVHVRRRLGMTDQVPAGP